MGASTAVLIPSTDSFSDVWPPALECLKRYWPDCPWPVYTGSNHKPWGERPVLVGADVSWAANLLKMLDALPAETDTVLLFLEDMLIGYPVNTAGVHEAREWMRDPDVMAVRVGPGNETYSHLRGHPAKAEIRLDSMYRIATTPTLWRVGYLRSILPHVASPWDFEIKGTKAAQQMPGRVLKWATQPYPVQILLTAITRGEWEQGALDWLTREDIPVDSTRRPIKNQPRRPGEVWPQDKPA